MAIHRHGNASESTTAEKVLRKLIKTLDEEEGACLGGFCEGSKKPPRSMMTCHVCWAVWDARQFLKRRTVR